MNWRIWVCAALLAVVVWTPAGAEAGGAQQDFAKGFELIKAGKLKQAAAKFEEGLASDPNNATAHFYLAETYLGLNLRDQAKSHYKKSLELDPFGGVAQDVNKRLTELGGGASAGSAISPSKKKSRYVANGGEVYDRKADLTWQRCSVGQRWNEDVGCVGVIKTFTYAEARKQGYGAWRLPTKDELTTLLNHERDRWPKIEIETFPDMNANFTKYWGTSTDNDCWFVDSPTAASTTSPTATSAAAASLFGWCEADSSFDFFAPRVS